MVFPYYTTPNAKMQGFLREIPLPHRSDADSSLRRGNEHAGTYENLRPRICFRTHFSAFFRSHAPPHICATLPPRHMSAPPHTEGVARPLAVPLGNPTLIPSRRRVYLSPVILSRNSCTKSAKVNPRRIPRHGVRSSYRAEGEVVYLSSVESLKIHSPSRREGSV